MIGPRRSATRASADGSLPGLGAILRGRTRMTQPFFPGTVSRMIEYRAVVRELDEARADVMARFGGDRDRWARADREMMCDALTRCEDAREGLTGALQRAETARVRAIRRRLERELWP
jgi:hypothetical protein